MFMKSLSSPTYVMCVFLMRKHDRVDFDQDLRSFFLEAADGHS